MNNNWFESRGLKVLEYQNTAITKVQDSLAVNNKTVLAACPSAGKTLMSIYIIEEYLKQNPNNKIVVLTHGTTILRTQFHDVLVDYNPDFTYDLIETGSDYANSNASVMVCLPQTLQNCEIKKADLLIVDEAHHFYLSTKAKMIKDFVKSSGAKKHLLLTGTPSKFILENLNKGYEEYKIIPVTLNTIFDAGMVSEAYVEVASSTYNFSLDDYNNDDELKTSIHIKSSETNKTLDDLLEKIVERLRSFRGNTYTNITPDWSILLKSLKKTMIACRSISQAEQVKKYLDKKGIDSALSTSENDIDSLEIKRFKDEDDCLVLIVVFRGVLGFNMEKLVNVVDMTTSHNVDRIYQLFSRVIRVDKNNPDQKKLFFKIAPNMLTDYYKHIMTAMLMLSDDEFFTKYNGKNFNDMEIPVKKVYQRKPSTSELTKPLTKARKYEPIDMEGLPVFEFFKNILHKKDQLLTTYCMTTVRDVRGEFSKIMPNGYWTFENCLESALKYNTVSDWKRNNYSSYQAAGRYGYLELCKKHMIPLTKPNGYWTKEKCFETSLKYSTLKEWKENNNGGYQASVLHGWYDEITAHMTKNNQYTYKENCLNSALKYNYKQEWKKNDAGAYSASIKNGWYKECTKHMVKPTSHNLIWTLEKCLESALKYQNITDWKNNDSKSLAAVFNHDKRNGNNEWLNKCKEHMIPIKIHGIWTRENCIESSKNFNSIKQWQINGCSGAYASAKKNGWLDECTAHMKKFK